VNIHTKYDVGHTFWVPRVHKKITQQELVWEGESWYKDIETYVPYAKLKKIVCIEVRVGRRTNITYGTKNVSVDGDEPVELAKYYPEENINNYTEEEALAIAQELAEQNKEYFGN
jgi:hypothetical protein